MEHFSDPSESRTITIIRDLELGRQTIEKFRNTSVSRYLEDHKRKNKKETVLRPDCMVIAESELLKLQWSDECLKQWVKNMFMGADVSQLESFYNRYLHTRRNKTTFFLMFVKDEL